MQIKNLSLTNFRNYKKRKFEFSPKTNLIVGPNTSGKTNLLEAISLLSFGSSPRAVLDREMVRQGAEFALVSGILNTSEVLEDSTSEVEAAKELKVQLVARKASVTAMTKKFKINGVAKRLSDFLPEFHVVLFSPEDLNLVIGSPDLRRRFLDFALANVDPGYRRALTEYEKVRKRRNRLLERINAGGAQESDLAFWDAKLLEFGTFLQNERKKFFDEINSLITNHSERSEEQGSRPANSAGRGSYFSLHYLISGLTVERLHEYRPKEIAAETTLIGPHRDDFRFTKTRINADLKADSRGSDLAKFGSRSEQRRAVLALKKAELEFVEKEIGERPVLLLDDIFSELDEENRSKVSSLLNEGQVIITTADIHHIPKVLQKDLEIIGL